ncbi:MAG: AAA family ATPase [Lepagella sp.]
MGKRQLKRLPVGIQTFSDIIEEDMLYIDKTEYIHDMIYLSRYIFMSRPRRFGKSLLLSTIQAYFEGKRELFRGLAMERLESDWVEYPVLRFSMASAKHVDKEQLERYIGMQLAEYEEQYGITKPAVDCNNRLTMLIKSAYRQSVKKVVVLIDEYDAPLLDVIHDDEALAILRDVIRNFYSPLKDCDPYLKFVFITGITKISQLSIFSELNNLTNISLDPKFGGICGITKEEMLTQMADYIEDLGEANGWSVDETIELLTYQYDGYHFAWPSSDIFNPYSLLQAFNMRRIDNYWFASGTPSYLIKMLRKYDTLPTEISRMVGGSDDFDVPTEQMTGIMPILYQSGYITIKDYDKPYRCYTLDIPNNEVRIGLTKSLVPMYVMPNITTVNNTARIIAKSIADDDIDGALSLLQKFLSSIPYCDNANSEGHYQQMLYIIFSLLSDYFVDVEIHTPIGRVDMVLRSKKAIYLFELKIDKSSKAAIAQIDLKDYASRFTLTGLPIVKVGINFDTTRRTISDWTISQ